MYRKMEGGMKSEMEQTNRECRSKSDGNKTGSQEEKSY